MGATAAVSGALGVANTIGGMQRAKAERQSQERANAIQASSTRMSLLAQRQSIIDQAQLETMQLATQKAFADEQGKLAQLDLQAQVNAQKANIAATELQTRMQLGEQQFNNNASLANARIGETNAKGQAAQQRFASNQQQLQANTQAGEQVSALARQGTEQLTQVEQQLKQAQGQYDASLVNGAANGFSSDALANQRTALTRDAVVGAGTSNQKASLNVDLAKEQQEYVSQVSSLLKSMGYNEADAIEAAGVAQAALAQAGYDLNSININSALEQLTNQTNIDTNTLNVQESNSKTALELDKAARGMSYDLGIAANKQGLASGLKGIEAQAKGATYQNPVKPSLLSNTLLLGSAAYGAVSGSLLKG